MKTKIQSPGKKISIFYFLVLLIITAVILIIYINNILAVNQLSSGNNDLREEIKQVIQNNDLLRADGELLSSYDRVKTVAQEKFELTSKETASGEMNKIILKKSQLK